MASFLFKRKITYHVLLHHYSVLHYCQVKIVFIIHRILMLCLFGIISSAYATHWFLSYTLGPFSGVSRIVLTQEHQPHRKLLYFPVFCLLDSSPIRRKQGNLFAHCILLRNVFYYTSIAWCLSFYRMVSIMHTIFDQFIQQYITAS